MLRSWGEIVCTTFLVYIFNSYKQFNKFAIFDEYWFCGNIDLSSKRLLQEYLLNRCHYYQQQKFWWLIVFAWKSGETVVKLKAICWRDKKSRINKKKKEKILYSSWTQYSISQVCPCIYYVRCSIARWMEDPFAWKCIVHCILYMCGSDDFNGTI